MPVVVEDSGHTLTLSEGERRGGDDIPQPCHGRPGQFIIAVSASPVPAGFDSHELTGVTLSVDPSVPVIPLVDSLGTQIGLFLGTLIDYRARRLVRDAVRLDKPAPDIAWTEQDWQMVEDAIYRHAGRFICLVAHRSGRRLYLDAGGIMSVVFEPERRRAAAITDLLLDDDEYTERLRTDLYEHLEIEDTGWFPSFLTAHRGVRRLICNHYLDLHDWSVHRHWPRRDELTTVEDATSGIDRIATVIEEIYETLIADGSVVCGLTAGYDTQLLLASARRFVDDMSFVTFQMSTDAAIDIKTAQTLASRFGLRHEVLPGISASEAEMQLWQRRVGHCVGGVRKQFHPSVRQLANYDYLVGGAAGEVARTFFWRSTDLPDTRLTARGLTARLGMPMHEEVVAATEEWLEHAPDVDSLVLLDLAYLELRLSPWAFAGEYGADTSVECIRPMVNREIFRLMLELPPEAKLSHGMFVEAVRRRWPDLLDVPFNRYGDYRDVLRLVRRVTQNPRLVFRKLRRMYG